MSDCSTEAGAAPRSWRAFWATNDKRRLSVASGCLRLESTGICTAWQSCKCEGQEVRPAGFEPATGGLEVAVCSHCRNGAELHACRDGRASASRSIRKWSVQGALPDLGEPLILVRREAVIRGLMMDTVRTADTFLDIPATAVQGSLSTIKTQAQPHTYMCSHPPVVRDA